MLGINIEKTIIYEDNTGTISLVKNEKVDGRTSMWKSNIGFYKTI